VKFAANSTAMSSTKMKPDTMEIVSYANRTKFKARF
jgi:hypothetical protein